MVRFEPVRGGLDAADLVRVAGLEAVCAVHDGVRLKLEWGVLRGRPADEVNDWVCRDGDRIVGFCGLYGFQPGEFELCGMVEPEHRRSGVARTLFASAVAAARARLPAGGQLLIVVDRAFDGGGAFAGAVGASYHSSEYSMRLTEPPTGATGLTMRQAGLSDAGFVASCLAPAFGIDPSWSMPDPARRPITMFSDGDEPVAVIHVAVEKDAARLYGFAVPPELRGRGYGGRALRQVAGGLLGDGHPAVELEVNTDNENALSLYRRSGFRLVSVIDYHALPLA